MNVRIPVDLECLGQVSTEIFSFSQVSKMRRVAPTSPDCPQGGRQQIRYEWILDESNLPQSNYIEIRLGNI